MAYLNVSRSRSPRRRVSSSLLQAADSIKEIEEENDKLRADNARLKVDMQLYVAESTKKIDSLQACKEDGQVKLAVVEAEKTTLAQQLREAEDTNAAITVRNRFDEIRCRRSLKYVSP